MVLLAMITPPIVKAQNAELRPVTSKYAIKNVTIVQSPGKVITNGSILVEDGVIRAVGTGISIPPDAWVIKADSMFVYAGFISGLSKIGVEKPKEEREDLDDKLTGTPPYEYAGITPNRSVRSLLSVEEKSIKDFRAIGFTTAHTAYDKGMLPGTGSIVLLGGTTPSDMLLKENVSMFSQLQGANGVYPNTVIGVMAKYRDLYRKSSQARDYQTKYDGSPSGMERPEVDEVLESLFPVVSKQMPVMFQSEGIKDIMRVKALQQDLGFSLMFAEVKQGWDAIPTFKSLGAPVFLSLDLPEWKEKESKDEDEESEDKAKEPSSEEIEEEGLKKRQMEIIKKYYAQAGQLAANGVPFGFSTMELKAKDFKANLLKVMENGLSEEKALAALTTQPAQIFGLSSTHGTVEVGKIANLIVTDTAYFTKDSNVRFVFVDGVKYEYEAKKKKKKKSGGEPVAVAGAWSYSTETPQGTGEGTITITGDPGNYTGTMSLSFNNSTNDINNIEVNGNNVTFNVKTNVGQEITIEISMDIDGDTFDGTLSVAQFGSFPMEGSKEPEN